MLIAIRATPTRRGSEPLPFQGIRPGIGTSAEPDAGRPAFSGDSGARAPGLPADPTRRGGAFNLPRPSGRHVRSGEAGAAGRPGTGRAWPDEGTGIGAGGGDVREGPDGRSPARAPARPEPQGLLPGLPPGLWRPRTRARGPSCGPNGRNREAGGGILGAPCAIMERMPPKILKRACLQALRGPK
jgi:hypothetical protein